MTNHTTEFRPDYSQERPGVFLEWILESRGIKKVDLARRAGRPTKTISEIISGKTVITPDTALQFEKVLGESAEYWLALEIKYQIQEARKKDREQSDQQRLSEWNKLFPIREMIKHGFIDGTKKKERMSDTLLKFFGVSSIAAFENYWENKINLARFKQYDHYSTDRYSIVVWLRQGEVNSQKLSTNPYDENTFRNALNDIRSLTRYSWASIRADLISICSNAGVAVSLVPTVKKTGLRGAAFWSRKDRATIVLSDLHKSEERVWFAFFHEAAHILLHSKKTLFIDEPNAGSEDEKIESEANEFSAEYLVPKQQLTELVVQLGGSSAYGNSKHVKALLSKHSKSIGVSEGLVLERLQHEGVIQWNTPLNNQVKRKLSFTD